MKQLDYTEGTKAQKNFEEGMKTLFSVSKDAVAKTEKKQAKKRAVSRIENARQPRASDKD